MNKIYKFGLALLSVCVSAVTLSSCSDWTDTESVDLVYPTPGEADPANYAKYLESLRKYKQGDHKLVYLWFANPSESQMATTRADRVSELPDSTDVVVLTNPTDVAAQTVVDMAAMREQMGTRFEYVIDYDAIKLAYLNHQALASDDEPYSVEWLDFLTDSTATALTYAEKYGFDGIIIGYNGKVINHLEGDELQDYKNNENTFIGIMDDWHKRHADMNIDFLGKPQNVANKELVNDCNILFLSESQSATSTYGFAMAVAMASVEGVPTDRFGMVTTFTDPNNEKVGYMTDGQLCVIALADWIFGQPEVKAAGFTNFVSDYYNLPNSYPVIRQAIQLMDPSNQ